MIEGELKVHVTAIEHWIERQLEIIAEPVGLSVEQRKQLQAIEKSIRQLSKSGIEIPDDLRRLKLDLSAHDVATVGSSISDEHKDAVIGLIDELKRLLDKALNIQRRTKKPDDTNVTKRNFRVSLKDLIDSGHLSANDQIEFSYNRGALRAKGEVSSEGAIQIQTNTGTTTFQSLSNAAVDITGRSLNGWIYWWKVNPDDSRVLLDDIRKQFLNERNKNEIL